MKGGLWQEAGRVLLILLSALLVAAGMHIFVFRAAFAPSGVDGLATMLQYLSEKHLGVRINAGVFTLGLNLPLLLAAGLLLHRRYVLYTLLYIGGMSVALLLYDLMGLYQYDCLAKESNEALIAAIFGGAAQGLTAIPLRLGGSSGGVDIVGGLLAIRYPHADLERLIAYVSYLVVGLSLLVYGDLGAVCLSVVSVFTCERVSAFFLRPMRTVLRVEILAAPAALPALAASLSALQPLAIQEIPTPDNATLLCYLPHHKKGALLDLLKKEEKEGMVVVVSYTTVTLSRA